MGMSFLCVFGPSTMLEGWVTRFYLQSTPYGLAIAFLFAVSTTRGREDQGPREGGMGRDGISERTLAYG
jgi:hypothetical protein